MLSFPSIIKSQWVRAFLKGEGGEENMKNREFLKIIHIQFKNTELLLNATLWTKLWKVQKRIRLR